MGTKLERIAEISATTKRPEFTSLYHLINTELLKQCHRELDGKKAVGIDKVTKEEYGKHFESNIADLVQRLRNKSYKPLPTRRVYIPKANGKLRPLGIVSYEDKIVQLAVKKILEAIYEPKFLNCMYGFRPKRGCHEAIKEVGNVKKCAVGKHPKSEKLGSTGQAACCARIHSRYFTGGSPSGLRVCTKMAKPPTIIVPGRNSAAPSVSPKPVFALVTTKTGITGRKTGVALNTGSSPRITGFPLTAAASVSRGHTPCGRSVSVTIPALRRLDRNGCGCATAPARQTSIRWPISPL